MGSADYVKLNEDNAINRAHLRLTAFNTHKK